MSEPLEESILRSLRRITRAIDLYSRKLSREHRLTGPQVVCLRQLRKSGAGSSPSELARAVSLSQATVTGILDRLEARGLVRRERSRTDRRRVNVQLTADGERLAAGLPSALQERFADRLADLPAENRAVIDTILQQVVSMMEATELEAAPVLQAGSILDGPAESS